MWHNLSHSLSCETNYFSLHVSTNESHLDIGRNTIKIPQIPQVR